MLLGESERVGIFIDGGSLLAAARSLEIDIDYKKLLRLFRDRSRLVRASYFVAMQDDAEYSRLRPLLDWLTYNGFSLVTKAPKGHADDGGSRRGRTDIGVELAVEALQVARSLDHLVLFSGNGDFRYLVAGLQQMGKRVTVISTMQIEPALVAGELRRQADQFIDLYDLRPMIMRAAAGNPGARGPATR